MTAHQNAARRLKALLRRTHFPVIRLREIAGSSGAPGAGSITCNPWDGIVAGDPRAALIIMHWTLLELSQLFAIMLLDLHCGGLQSLTDYKFVGRVFTILHKKFNCRPQLTAEQFLSHGFAEVKMRLLADIVEIVMRTHYALAQKADVEGVGSSNSNAGSDPPGSRSVAPATTGYVHGGITEAGDAGRYWSSQREGSCQDPADVVPPSPPRVHSPSLASEVPFVSMCGSGSGAGAGAASGAGAGGVARVVATCSRLHSLSSPSSMSVEQNVSPPSALIHGGQMDRCARFNRDRASLWIRGAVDGSPQGSSAAVVRPGGRSPLGPRPAQGPLYLSMRHVGNLDHETTKTMEPVNLLLPPRQTPSSCGAQSDWHAVQSAFGSPNGLHVPVPCGMPIPMSPHPVPSVPDSCLRSGTGGVILAAGATAGAIGAEKVTKAETMTSGNPGVSLEMTDPGAAVGRLVDITQGHPNSEARRADVATGTTVGEERKDVMDADRVTVTLSAALAQFQRQMEGLLDRHSRTLDDRISGIEEMLSARLTILETKVQALDHRSRLRT